MNNGVKRYASQDYVNEQITWDNMKNKPFCSEEKDVFLYEVQETRVGTTSSPAMFTKLGFVAGETYKVIWNGVEYECEAFEATMLDETGIGIGNKMAIGGDNTGEPFVIGDIANQSYGAVIDLTASEIGTATFGVSQFREVVTKIPDKYLPEQKKNLSEFNNDLYGTFEVTETIYENLSFSKSNFTLDDDMELRSVSLTVGDNYIVLFDGEEYRLTCKLIEKADPLDNIRYIGNGALQPINDEDTGEPFCFAKNQMDGTWLTLLYPQITHSVVVKKIVGTSIKQIPKKFVEASYGEKEIELLPETTFTLSSGQAEYTSLGLVIGDTYIVNWNGKDYECVAEPVTYQGMGVVVIGNAPMFFGTGDSGHPFAIGDVSGLGCIIADTTGASSTTLSIKHFVIEKINSKYLNVEWSAVKTDEKTECLVDETLTNFATINDNLKQNYINVDYKLFENVEKVSVEINDVEYILDTMRTYTDEGAFDKCIVGNLALAEGIVSSGLPFLIIFEYDAVNFEGSKIYTTLDTTNGITLKVWNVKEKATKLPDEFINTEWMATKKVVETDIISLMTINSPENSSNTTVAGTPSLIITEGQVSFEVGKTYKVVVNNSTQSCKVKVLSYKGLELIAIGNESLMDSSLSNTGESFLIYKIDGESDCAIATNTTTPFTLQVIEETEEPNKLPNEFLDLDWIPKTVESDGTVIIDNFVYTSGDRGDSYTDWANGYGVESSIQMKVGEKYNVYWNEEKYTCVVDKTEGSDVEDGTHFVGNKYFITGDNADNTGEPFFIQQIGSGDNIVGYLVMISKTDTSASIKCTVTEIIEEVNKIPEEYLPMESITEAVIKALPTWTGGSY